MVRRSLNQIRTAQQRGILASGYDARSASVRKRYARASSPRGGIKNEPDPSTEMLGYIQTSATRTIQSGDKSPHCKNAGEEDTAPSIIIQSAVVASLCRRTPNARKIG